VRAPWACAGAAAGQSVSGTSKSFYLDVRKPILDARSIELQRGAGLYYDRCIAVRTKHDVSVILVDQGSHQLLRKDFGERGRIDFRLAMFNEKGPLW
jgi:hypothetical protein